ncbi:MAG TPA: DNRLRE domain-containing protein [Candidatus Paceibacterota bacterium]|nr:DNRLRE domain-containing protein [Candidatus Paceibacterota bacterium]
MAKIKLSRKNKKKEEETFWADFLLGFVPVFILYVMIAGSVIVSKTRAILQDNQSSIGSIIQAGILDFSLNQPSSFSSAPLQKGESVGVDVSLLNDGNLNFQYIASTTIMGGDQDLCSALTLEASLNGATIYDNSVSEFASPLQNYVNPSDWGLSVTLPDTASDSLQNKSCNLRFVFSGWQNGLSSNQGFNNLEFIDVTINSGEWIIPEPGDLNMSPISDSYIRQDRATTNYGGGTTMLVQSRSGSRNYRAVIRFNFKLPSGVIIDSSFLKLYMTSAPSASRNYEARSLLGSWTETGVNWSNQPASSASPSDTITTGTTRNLWMSWNVKNDVQSIVNGAANYGWLIKDVTENSSMTRGATFASRENSTVGVRPVLEVAFSAPPASTDHLVVNEVYYQVAVGKGVETTDEWVELYNPTTSDIDLLGWKICDNGGCDTLGSYTLPSRSFAVVTPNTSNFDTYWTLAPGAIKITLPNTNIGGNGLGNTGDRIYIQNASSTAVDGISYGTDVSQLNPPVSTGGLGSSLARIIKGYDFNVADDWITNSTPNPGTNPGSDSKEIMRFTDYGTEVAASSVGLSPLITNYIPADTDMSGEEETPTEIFKQCSAGSMPVAKEEATFTEKTGGTIEPVAASSTTTDPIIEPDISTTTPEIITDILPAEATSTDQTVDTNTPSEPETTEALPGTSPADTNVIVELPTAETETTQDVLIAEEQAPIAEPAQEIDPVETPTEQ